MQKNTVLGMEISMFTYGGPQIHLRPATVASNVFEARHFVLKFMQICKNTQQCSPIIHNSNCNFNNKIYKYLHYECYISLFSGKRSENEERYYAKLEELQSKSIILRMYQIKLKSCSNF